MTDQRTSRSEASGNLSQTTTDVWRKEIHARVAGYRTRRGRRIEGAYTMRFPFPPLEPDVSGPATIAPEDSPSQEQVGDASMATRSEEHTSELQSLRHLVCRLLL